MRIIYLDLDALNPDHLSCYGYARQTSPTIDQIAAEGLRCTNAYCSDAPCLPSRTAFYQGRFGIQTGVVGHGGTAADPKREGYRRGFRSCYEEQSMARKLQLAGYRTAMISPFGQRHAAHHFYAGFNEMYNTGDGGMESAEVVSPVIDKWLADNADRDDWYLHINFWDIHTPYRVPASFGDPFADTELPLEMSDQQLADDVARCGPHSAQELVTYSVNNTDRFPRLPESITDRASLKKWFDAYDTTILYTDQAIARIVDQLKAAGVYDNTAIIISSDHGENQAHLGIYGEHGTADHGTCHIPFIVKWPGTPAGQVDDGLHYNVDWAPTLMDMIGKPELTPDLWDGKSFADTVKTGTPAGQDELIVSQCAHICQRSVRFDEGDHRWIYIRTYHDGFQPFPDHMLFDLATDPHERHNLAEAHPDVVLRAAFKLTEWHNDQMYKMAKYCSDVIDPLWTVMSEGGPQHAGLLPYRQPGQAGFQEYLKQLEDSGRSEGAAALREQYAEGHLTRNRRA
ncbi:MAG: sulfatase [Planctomycetota bacterium]